MAAITSAGSGNWNSTTPNTPWPSGTVPVSGDTVTIANGHTITIPVGYTAVVGTSPANNSGTPAIQCAGSGTGILIINGTLQWKGPIRQANATWTVGAGGILTYDASGASTPATALWSWEISDNNLQANAKLVFNGTSASHCTVKSVGNVRSGGFGNITTAWSDGGRIEATYVDFSYMGASGGEFCKVKQSGAVSFFLDNCIVDNCAQIDITISATSTIRFRQTQVTNPSNTTYVFQITQGAVKTSGNRIIQNCDITGRVYFLSLSAASSGLVIQNNIFRQIAYNNEPIIITDGATITTWDQNLIVISVDSSDPSARIPAGTLTNTYLYRQGSSGILNAHPVYGQVNGSDLIVDGWIIQYLGQDVGSDIFELASPDSPTDKIFRVIRSVFLANPVNGAAGSLVNNSAGFTQTHIKIYFDHNTIGGGTPTGNAVYGVGAEAGTVWPAGAVLSIQSNLMWQLSPDTALIANSHSSATINNGAVVAADYNNAYNITGSIYGVPSGQFATTPGAHDLAVNPLFLDLTRSLLSFDQGYLGAPVATAWVTATSYAIGDIRSTSDASFYANAVYNYRCTTAHTSSSTKKPGSGNDWSTYWEPAGLKSISDSILAGVTIGSNSLVGECIAWIKAGFAPRNALLRYAAHDGGTIGAVEGIGSNSMMLLGVS